jgi:hypothetical protein
VSEPQAESLPTRIIVGDPTSSLSKAKALDVAQHVAAFIPGAGVAQLPDDYTGKYAPAIPSYAVFVVEPVEYPHLKPFDLVVFTDPMGQLCVRRLLGKTENKAIVGFEFLPPDTQAEIAPSSCVGRIVATVFFDPLKKDAPEKP